MEPIWYGDICDLETARYSICLVDSIHHFAVTHHRDFVAKYLKAWPQIADQELSAQRSCDSSTESNLNRSHPRLRRGPPEPEWKTILGASTSRETRRLNKLKRRKFRRRRKDEKDWLYLYRLNEKGVTQFDVEEQINYQIARKQLALQGCEGQLGGIVNPSLYRYKQVVFTEQAWQ